MMKLACNLSSSRYRRPWRKHERLFKSTSALIGQSLPPNPANAESAAPFHHKEYIERLLKALDSDDMNLVEDLLPSLFGHVPEKQIQQLQAHIDAFDFRGAEALVNNWR